MILLITHLKVNFYLISYLKTFISITHLNAIFFLNYKVKFKNIKLLNRSELGVFRFKNEINFANINYY